MSDGVQDQNIREWAAIDGAETIGVKEGMAMEYVSDRVVKVFRGTGNYAGLAMLTENSNPALAGEKIGLDHFGIRKAWDSGEDTLNIGDPVKASTTATKEGMVRLFVDGTDSELDKIGFVSRTKDADGLMYVRVIGGR